MDKKQYDALIAPAQKIVVKKHEDYNHGVKLEDYFPFGHKSHVQMLHVKALRLVALAQNEAQPNFESVEDTLYDMINYAVFYLDHLKRERQI